MIILSCVALMLEDPRPSPCGVYQPSACAGVSGGELKLVLGYSDYVFCVLFTLEMVVRLAAFGPKKYAKSPWNLLDAFVVVISWLAVGLPAVEGLTALRALRALRALKLAAHIGGMRVWCSTH